MSNKSPNLNDFASFDDFDIDQILAKESGFSAPTGVPSPPVANNQQQPVSVQQQPTSIQQTEDLYTKQLTEILEEETGDNIGVRTKQQQPKNDYYDDFFYDDSEEQVNEPEEVKEEPITNPYQLTIKLASELDLLRLPDDVKIEELNADDLKYYAEETKQIQFEEAIEEIRASVEDDPYMSDLIDYALEGRKFADLPKMQKILETEMKYEQLDTTNVTVQKALVNRFLSEGLNPENPRDKELLSLIPQKISYFENQLVLRAKADEAKNYFIEKQQRLRDIEFKKVQELKEQEFRQQQLLEEENKKWDANFKKALRESKMSENRKRDIVEQTRPYHYNDGVAPLWRIKQEMIFNDPVLFQHYLAFISNFDAQQNKFVSSVTKEKNTIIDEITNNLNKKSQQQGNINTSSGNYGQQKQPKNIVDPSRDLSFR